MKSNPTCDSGCRGRRRIKLTAACLIAAASIVTAASSAAPGETGRTVTLTAGMIDILSGRITATGSPVLSSAQGVMRAAQFTVTLDKQGRATQAEASGGVRFNLAAPAAPYRTVTGTCDQAVLYPVQRHAVLTGGLQGTMEGPGAAPISLAGSERADLFATSAGHLGHVELSGGRSTVTTRA